MKTSRAVAKTLAGIALASLSLASSVSHAFEWSDTSIGWRYGTKFQEPYNGQDITKNIFNFTHADGFKYGTNFLNVDLLQSNYVDSDAQEAFVVYRNTLDFGKIAGSSYAWGPFRGFGLTSGFDWNTKNDPGYGSKKRMLVLGPTVMMDVPGFLNFSVQALHESNQPNSIPTRYTYDTHAQLNVVWAIPLGGSGFSFEGFLNWIAPKGLDEFGNPTATETNLDMVMWYDAGRHMGLAQNTFRVGFEYQYWRNKFGNPSSVPGSLARTPMIRAEMHF